MAILSIQSHVAYGYVGNRAATFPLQRLGYDVNVVNTVQFSNHTGYGKWRGEIFTASHIEQVIQGLVELGVLENCQAVLSGYLGKPEIGREVLKVVESGRQQNPELIYLCDPVMGDVGRGVFVQADIPEFITNYAIPQATILTPNHFEMELLTKQAIHSVVTAKQACAALRVNPRQIIIITSFKRDDAFSEVLEMFLSAPEGDFLISTPYLAFPKAPNGTGDLFSALFLGHYLTHANAVKALELTASSVYGILQYTFNQAVREMQLVKAQTQLIQPDRLFKCEPL